jgi:uncharacterized SAM-binding protein YcdF (DUF218 family)
MSVLAAIARVVAWPLTSVDPIDPGEPADAIVILGAPLRADGTLTPQAEERVVEGVSAYRRGLAPLICLAGGHGPAALQGTTAEAEGMARWVRRMGVPERDIVVDRASATTHENALRAAELLLPSGRRRVWLVTQRFHTRRAKYYFRRAGFEPLALRVTGGFEQREVQKTLRWIVREYLAWGLALGRSIAPARRRARGTVDEGP